MKPTNRIAAPKGSVAEDIQQSAWWQIAFSLAMTEQERAVLIDSFVYALAPRAILARHPALFANIWAVYDTRHELLVRLQRSAALQEPAVVTPNDDRR
jgi:hypothetical protein